MERIVVTGMGAVTPIGIGVEPFWNNLIGGVGGVGGLTRFDASAQAVRIGAEVKDFDPFRYNISRRQLREMDLFMQYAYVAADEAIAHARLLIEPRRTGIVMATAMGGTAAVARTQHETDATGSRTVSPRFVPQILGNEAAAQISIAHNIQGPSLTVSTACSSGGDAITLGALLLRAGMCDVVLVAGGEASLCPPVLQSLTGARALSRRNEEPERASRPFDADRDGFVMGEGGGALVLETMTHASARGARVLAELAGYANNTDAYHITAPNPEGTGAAACMRSAIDMAGISPADVGYINAHGTSTMLGDIAEIRAVKDVFGSHPEGLCLSSTKGATGHMMAAGGIVEVIACILALMYQVVPPTLNLDHPDEACDLDCVPHTAREVQIDYAMSNAFGFGGQNSSILLKRAEKEDGD